MVKIGVVLTTFNRVEYLKKALNAYSAQITKPEYLIIVNNGSTDSTYEFLNQWITIEEGFEKIVVHSPNNTGGSGGFYQGLQKSLELDASWVLISDDDAYPDNDMLSVIEEYIKTNDCSKIAAICSSVIYKENEIISPHIIRQKIKASRIVSYRVSEAEYEMNSFEISTLTFVGSVINKEMMKKSGLPEKDYFIYHDDGEFAFRLRKYGKFICLPRAKIFHDCNNSIDIRGTWKAYYELRNRILMYKKHYNHLIWRRLVVEQYIKRVSFIARIIKKYSNEERQLYITAIKDGIAGRSGLHEKYCPGYRSENKN